MVGKLDTTNDFGWCDSLRPYQRAGVQFLATRDSALLADEMGLGKTVQAIMALRIRLQQPQIKRSLIVAPAAVCRTWQTELERWAPEIAWRRVDGSQRDRIATYLLPVPVLIASYEQLRTDTLRLDPNTEFGIVVLDEAQRIKNASSETALACRLLPRDSSWALTGTPVENRAGDLVSIFGFVKPRLVTQNMDKEDLHDKIQPYFLRRRKKEVLPELPPIIIQDVSIELRDEQLIAYEGLWETRSGIAQNLRAAGSVLNAFQYINRLKQLCNYHEPSEQSAKLDWLSVYADSLFGFEDKVLVFSQYVETLKRIARRISTLPVHLYHGGLSSTERHTAVEQFENRPGPRMLLISLRAGGVGLNIPSASAVVLFDRWWNPAVEDQAIQRAHRFGRTRVLYVSRLLVCNSIEERIQSILKAKAAIFRAYVDEAHDLSEEVLSRADLMHLLGVTDSPGTNQLLEGKG